MIQDIELRWVEREVHNAYGREYAPDPVRVLQWRKLRTEPQESPDRLDTVLVTQWTPWQDVPLTEET